MTIENIKKDSNTSDRDTDEPTTAKFQPASGLPSRLHKVALFTSIGLVVAGVIGTVVAPPGSVTRAPATVLERAGLPDPEPASLMSVERENLPDLKSQPDDLTVAEIRRVLAYELENIKNGEAVPRVFLASMPEDLSDIQETDVKKALLFKSVLPLVLQVNNEILAARTRLEALLPVLESGEKPSATDRLWLVVMSERYGVRRYDVAALLKKVDIVPPSLALAQAANESAWGTARFTREGNALFGQWTWDEGNLVPKDREDGKQHMVKRFDSLIDSVRAYVRNLNTHRAYREFRDQRARLRRGGEPLDGRVLADALYRYSERGMKYVNEIRAMISYNGLGQFDDARLDDDSAEADI